MKITAACLVSLFGAAVLLAGGVYSYRQETRSAVPVTVDAPERDVGEVALGVTQVVFRVTNPSNHAAEVISSPDGCARGCCMKPTTTERQPIPAGGSVDVVCELHVFKDVQFEFNGNLFINDGGLRVVKVTVRGTGVAPRVSNGPQ